MFDSPENPTSISEQEKSQIGCLIRTTATIAEHVSGKKIQIPDSMYLRRKRDDIQHTRLINKLVEKSEQDGVITRDEDTYIKQVSFDHASILTQRFIEDASDTRQNPGEISNALSQCDIEYSHGGFRDALARANDPDTHVAVICSVGGVAHIMHVGYKDKAIYSFSDDRVILPNAIDKIDGAMKYISDVQDEFSYIVFTKK